MTAETAAVCIGAPGAAIAAATGHLAGGEPCLAVAVPAAAGPRAGQRPCGGRRGWHPGNRRPGRCRGPGPRWPGTARTGRPGPGGWPWPGCRRPASAAPGPARPPGARGTRCSWLWSSAVCRSPPPARSPGRPSLRHRPGRHHHPAPASSARCCRSGATITIRGAGRRAGPVVSPRARGGRCDRCGGCAGRPGGFRGRRAVSATGTRHRSRRRRGRGNRRCLLARPAGPAAAGRAA